MRLMRTRIVRISDITEAGWTTVGTEGTGAGQFRAPVGVALDGSGRIYVADFGKRPRR